MQITTKTVRCSNARLGLPDCRVNFEVRGPAHLATSNLCPVCRSYRDRELNTNRCARYRARKANKGPKPLG